MAVPVTRWQGLHKRGCISKRISKKFLEILLEIDIPYGVRDFSRFEQKRAENPCKHGGFSFFYRLLSSRKIRQFLTGQCALKTVWAHAHKGSNPFPSAIAPIFRGFSFYMIVSREGLMSENSSRLILFRLTNPLKCGIIHSLHSLILRSKFTFGKNVGFACHIFERCELCSNRSETAFFGAWFRLRTFFSFGGQYEL